MDDRQVQAICDSIMFAIQDSQPTLRDRFAMAARDEDLECYESWPLAKCADYIGVAPEDYNPLQDWPKVRAKARYKFADAMLKVREEKP